MKIALIGSTSQISIDLVMNFYKHTDYECILYSRRPGDNEKIIKNIGCNSYQCKEIGTFHNDIKEIYDVVINFVGVGDPQKAKSMTSTIQDVTKYYDELCLSYINKNPDCKYIFLSSGAAYGSDFSEPASINKLAKFNINNLSESEKYGLAKFTTEMRHRSLPQFSIVDIRVFNYFSRNQNVETKFFITDILRSILNDDVCEVSSDEMVRDYLHPEDFYQIIECIISAGKLNAAVDCYTRNPITKTELLEVLSEKYGLKYSIRSDGCILNATGIKTHYYSESYALETLGYRPKFSSLNTILTEFDAILSKDI